MIFLNEHEKKINDLYSKLIDLKKGKKVLENAMHKCFYNKDLYHQLYIKLKKLNDKIEFVKYEIAKEKELNEKSRKNI